jgi:hypothetical protein
MLVLFYVRFIGIKTVNKPFRVTKIDRISWDSVTVRLLQN